MPHVSHMLGTPERQLLELLFDTRSLYPPLRNNGNSLTTMLIFPDVVVAHQQQHCCPTQGELSTCMTTFKVIGMVMVVVTLEKAVTSVANSRRVRYTDDSIQSTELAMVIVTVEEAVTAFAKAR